MSQRTENGNALDLLRLDVELPADEDVGAVMVDILNHKGHVGLGRLPSLKGRTAVEGDGAELRNTVDVSRLSHQRQHGWEEWITWGPQFG